MITKIGNTIASAPYSSTIPNPQQHGYFSEKTFQDPRMRLYRLKDTPMDKQKYMTYAAWQNPNDSFHDDFISQKYPQYERVTDVPGFFKQHNAYLASLPRKQRAVPGSGVSMADYFGDGAELDAMTPQERAMAAAQYNAMNRNYAKSSLKVL